VNEVMRFVDDDPVRPTGFGPGSLATAASGAVGERGSVLERHAEQVHDDRRPRVLQAIDDLVDGRRSMRIADEDRVLDRRVIPLGIEDQVLVLLLGEPLEDPPSSVSTCPLPELPETRMLNPCGSRSIVVPSSVLRGPMRCRHEARPRDWRDRRRGRDRSASATPAPWSASVTTSARSLTAGSALATATPHSQSDSIA